MNKIRRQVNELYMQLEMGRMFNAYHDMMYYMCKEIDYLEDDDIEDAKDILAKCKAIIKAQNILQAQGLLKHNT